MTRWQLARQEMAQEARRPTKKPARQHRRAKEVKGMRIVPKTFTSIPMREYIPRTGLNLLRYKRRLRWMASEVCPPDKSWEVIVALFASVALFVGAFIAWGHGLV